MGQLEFASVAHSEKFIHYHAVHDRYTVTLELCVRRRDIQTGQASTTTTFTSSFIKSLCISAIYDDRREKLNGPFYWSRLNW